VSGVEGLEVYCNAYTEPEGYQMTLVRARCVAPCATVPRSCNTLTCRWRGGDAARTSCACW